MMLVMLETLGLCDIGLFYPFFVLSKTSRVVIVTSPLYLGFLIVKGFDDVALASPDPYAPYALDPYALPML